MGFKEDLVQTALQELNFWMTGNFRECVQNIPANQQQGSKRVAKYWKDGLGERNLNGCINVAWSAAFICWCMRQAQMPIADFAFSAGHHAYIRWAINNTKMNKPGKTYYGQRLNSYEPKPGDLIAQWRKVRSGAPDPNISFDIQPDDFYPSHCDIVVEVTANSIVGVGGNVSQRVKKTIFAANEGILSPKRELICVLECRKQ
jgi:hypothetical protein